MTTVNPLKWIRRPCGVPTDPHHNPYPCLDAGSSWHPTPQALSSPSSPLMSTRPGRTTGWRGWPAGPYLSYFKCVMSMCETNHAFIMSIPLKPSHSWITRWMTRFPPLAVFGSGTWSRPSPATDTLRRLGTKSGNSTPGAMGTYRTADTCTSG